MNQAIQFLEREWWDESLQAACFNALVDGFQLVCTIDGEALLRRLLSRLQVILWSTSA